MKIEWERRIRGVLVEFNVIGVGGDVNGKYIAEHGEECAQVVVVKFARHVRDEDSVEHGGVLDDFVDHGGGLREVARPTHLDGPPAHRLVIHLIDR